MNEARLTASLFQRLLQYCVRNKIPLDEIPVKRNAPCDRYMNRTSKNDDIPPLEILFIAMNKIKAGDCKGFLLRLKQKIIQMIQKAEPFC